MRVGIIHAYKPIFTPVKSFREQRITFVGVPDTFKKSDFDFDKESDILYSKIQKSMGVLSPQDVVLKANYVSKKTGIPLDDVYNTMGILSQYSSYKSLKSIEDNLAQNEISSIRGLPLDLLKKDIPLSNVMAYISERNFSFNNYNDALMIDSKLLKAVKKMSKEDRKSFYNYINANKLKFLYIENFENSYNFLNQEKNFEDYTLDVLKKAKKFQKRNSKSLDYNVRYVLNGENYKDMKILSGGGHIEVIKPENKSYSPENIADNLNPIMPSKNEFKSLIEQISDNKSDVQKEILNFLNKTLTIITPKQYETYLQNMHTQLLEYLIKNGKTMDDVYFIVPSVDKSFVLANYVYNKVNHIENPKYLFLPKDYGLSSEAVEKLPKNAVAVVIDDCILSGLSMKGEIFPYIELVESLPKDKNIIFAPIVCLNLGKKVIESLAMSKDRDDKVIYGKLLPDLKMKSKNLTLVHNINTDTSITTSVLFPYMGPDFNCEELVPLYERFLYNKNAQKVCIGTINNFTYG